MKRFFLWPLLTLSMLLFFMGCCSRYSTGSTELDKVINADYGTWGQKVESNVGLYEQELRKLNPHYEQGRRESITNAAQKVILSLLAIQKKDGVIVELGSWTGGGVLLMAPYLTHDKSYHAVDTFNADKMPDFYIQSYLKGRRHFDVFKENIAPLKEKVVVEQGTTNERAAVWPKNRMIDLIFIDADHAYMAVSADWRNWSPFVRKGGVIAFHDYYVRKEGGHKGVRRLVDSLIASKAIKKLYSIEGLAWYVVD